MSRTVARSARGFAVMTAIFLIVVLGLLGTVIVSLATTQSIDSVRDLRGSQAYFAAKAGLEWGVYRVLQGGGACSGSSTVPALAGSASGFTVTVTCAASAPVDEAGSSVTVYQITSTAARGALGAPDYAERQLQAVVSTP